MAADAHLSAIAVVASHPGQASYLSTLIKFAGYNPVVLPDGQEGTVPGEPILAASAASLQAFWERYGADERVPGPIILLVPRPEIAGEGLENVHVIQTPLKAAALISHLQRILGAFTAAEPIKVGEGIFDPASFCLRFPNGKEIRLTEKEAAIVLSLSAHRNMPVSKERLLADVWEYVQGVETHTIETHIYRLRQKIEKNPAQPDLLVTVEEGYMLKD